MLTNNNKMEICDLSLVYILYKHTVKSNNDYG